MTETEQRLLPERMSTPGSKIKNGDVFENSPETIPKVICVSPFFEVEDVLRDDKILCKQIQSIEDCEILMLRILRESTDERRTNHRASLLARDK